jgi:hypothetical protein
MKKLILISLALIFTTLAAAAYYFRSDLRRLWLKRGVEEIELAEITSYQDPGFAMGTTATTDTLDRREQLLTSLPEEVPEAIRLDVPFICQNPFKNAAGWQDHDESCEEAAVMQALYYLQRVEHSPQRLNEIILDSIEWQELPEHLGSHQDITGEELEYFTENYFQLASDEVFFFKKADQKLMQQLIAFGLPVVVPTMAKDLHNPYYREQDFHMVTLVGYNQKKAIANDVGTQHGANFPYDWDNFIQANQNGGGGILVIWPRSVGR